MQKKNIRDLRKLVSDLHCDKCPFTSIFALILKQLVEIDSRPQPNYLAAIA